jgi:hypothetical protein
MIVKWELVDNIRAKLWRPDETMCYDIWRKNIPEKHIEHVNSLDKRIFPLMARVE